MLTKEQYLKNPCRASSLPFWKTARISVPEQMKILHADVFDVKLLEQYQDEPYFRLKHDLKVVEPAALPEGYSWTDASVAEFAGQINGCYPDIGVTPVELQGYRERAVFCPEMWVAVREDRTGVLAATGIGELDREIGEGILEWIQVSRGHRGRGLGGCIVRELLRRMQGRAEFAVVSGRCGNPTNPEGLYRKCGFAGDDVWHILKKRE